MSLSTACGIPLVSTSRITTEAKMKTASAPFGYCTTVMRPLCRLRKSQSAPRLKLPARVIGYSQQGNSVKGACSTSVDSLDTTTVVAPRIRIVRPANPPHPPDSWTARPSGSPCAYLGRGDWPVEGPVNGNGRD
jgi:hypothetical protein